MTTPLTTLAAGPGPSARTVVMAGHDGVTMLTWNRTALDVVAHGSLPQGAAALTAVCAAPGVIVTGDARGQIALWRRARNDDEKNLVAVAQARNDDGASVRALALTGAARDASVWSGSTSSTIVERLRSHMSVRATHALSPHDSVHALLVDGARSRVIVVSAAAVTIVAEKMREVVHANTSFCAGAITGGGDVVITGDIDGTAVAWSMMRGTRLWEHSGGVPDATDDHPADEVTSMAVSPDDHLVAIASASGVRVLDVATGSVTAMNPTRAHHVVWCGKTLICFAAGAVQ